MTDIPKAVLFDLGDTILGIPNCHVASWSEFVELFAKGARSTGEAG